MIKSNQNLMNKFFFSQYRGMLCPPMQLIGMAHVFAHKVIGVDSFFFFKLILFYEERATLCVFRCSNCRFDIIIA